MIELRGLHLGNIARSPAESVRPDLWPDHAWVPALGCTGGVLYDLCTTLLNGGTVYGSVSWGASGLSNGGVGALWLGPIGLLGSGQPLAYTGDFSLFMHCPRIDSAPTNSVLVSCRNRQYGWEVQATSGGVWAFRANQLSNNFGVLGTSPFSAVQANQSIGVVFDSTVAEMYSGGVASGPLCTVTGGINYVYGTRAIASTLMGTSIDYTATTLGRYVDGEVGAMLSFNFALTHAQILDLTADPILPFRRRVPVFYSVPSGGGSSLAASSAWRVFTAAAIDTAWAIRAALDGATSWAVLTESGTATGWRIAAASDADTGWRIAADLDADTAWRLHTAAESPSAWRILAASEADTAWRIAADLGASTAWGILTSMGAATAWAIIAAGTLLANTGWAIRTDADADTGWHVKTDTAADTAWAVRNASDAATAWGIQTALAEATSWRITTDLQADTAWTVITDMDADAAWNILRADPIGTAWHVCTDLDTPTAWAVFSDIIPEPVRLFLAPGRQFILNAASRVLIITKTRP